MSNDFEDSPRSIYPPVWRGYAEGKLYADDPPEKINWHLDVTAHSDGKIAMTLHKDLVKGACEVLGRWLIDTREKVVREALIKLGWTPPGAHMTTKENEYRNQIAKLIAAFDLGDNVIIREQIRRARELLFPKT